MSVAEKLTEIAENVPKVFEAGVAQGYEAGYEDGKNGADFWKKYQLTGRRTDYSHAFSNYDDYNPSIEDQGWDTADFKPEYSMQPTNAEYMFSGIRGEKMDLVECFESRGLTLSFSGCKNLRQAFSRTSSITHIGVIDARNATDISRLFMYNTKLEKVDLLIVKKSHTFTGVFSNCPSLRTITIQGEIGNSIQFHRDTRSLSEYSVKNIVYALSDDVTGKTITFHTETADRLGGENSAEWEKLMASKPNWTFSFM